MQRIYAATYDEDGANPVVYKSDDGGFNYLPTSQDYDAYMPGKSLSWEKFLGDKGAGGVIKHIDVSDLDPDKVSIAGFNSVYSTDGGNHWTSVMGSWTSPTVWKPDSPAYHVDHHVIKLDVPYLPGIGLIGAATDGGVFLWWPLAKTVFADQNAWLYVTQHYSPALQANFLGGSSISDGWVLASGLQDNGNVIGKVGQGQDGPLEQTMYGDGSFNLGLPPNITIGEKSNSTDSSAPPKASIVTRITIGDTRARAFTYDAGDPYKRQPWTYVPGLIESSPNFQPTINMLLTGTIQVPAYWPGKGRVVGFMAVSERTSGFFANSLSTVHVPPSPVSTLVPSYVRHCVSFEDQISAVAGYNDRLVFVGTAGTNKSARLFLVNALAGASVPLPFPAQPNDTSVVGISWADAATCYVLVDMFGVGTHALYRTRDAGMTWQQVGLGLPWGKVYSILADPLVPGRLWVVNDADVFVSTNFGQTFATSSTGLPARPHCSELLLASGRQEQNGPWQRWLFLTTYGRGVWRAYLDSPTVPSR